MFAMKTLLTNSESKQDTVVTTQSIKAKRAFWQQTRRYKSRSFLTFDKQKDRFGLRTGKTKHYKA